MPDMKRIFAKLTLLAAAGLLLVPGITYWFTGHAEQGFSSELREGLTRSIAGDAQMSATDKAGARAIVQAMTIGDLCDGAYPNLGALQAEVCATTAEVGQFHLARTASAYTLLLGFATLALIAALALLAYFVPRHQTKAFGGGWWSLRAISAIEVTMQGAMLVWLSFWLTAYFFNLYAVKLIVIAAVLAAAGVFVAIAAIFKRAPMVNAVSGELISEAQAPQLWARIKQFSQQLNTEPPAQMIGGIDANFFVAQSPIRLPDANVSGRTLFVSLPLLRAIGRDEADAVLAHEMAHFSGGDTEAGAALGPKLNAYAHYMQALGQSGLTILAFYVLNLFRAAFELALSRANRAREFTADQTAARLTSPQAVSRALVRIAAYANYRNTVERELFAHDARHQGPLQVADRVAQGLPAFTQSESFQSSMMDAEVPHPFDSHPPLFQRMEHVGAVIAATDFAAIVATTPEQTWIEFIPDAGDIEARLWHRYESAFADEHEQSLAVRYEPANDAERAIVLKYFPDVAFAAKKDKVLRITHAGIETPDANVSWDNVASMQYADGSFGTSDTLTITHPEKGVLGTSKTTKLKLPLNTKDRDGFKAVLGQYWQRHQIMRKLRAEVA